MYAVSPTPFASRGNASKSDISQRPKISHRPNNQT